MKGACVKALDEWNNSIKNASSSKNWRKLFYAIDEAYTVMHICEDSATEYGFEMLTSHIYLNLTKLIFGFIYRDIKLHSEYLMRVFKPSKELPNDLLEEIHKIANDKNEVDIDEIKKYTLKLLSSIINFIYTPL